MFLYLVLYLHLSGTSTFSPFRCTFRCSCVCHNLRAWIKCLSLNCVIVHLFYCNTDYSIFLCWFFYTIKPTYKYDDVTLTLAHFIIFSTLLAIHIHVHVRLGIVHAHWTYFCFSKLVSLWGLCYILMHAMMQGYPRC